MNPPGLRPAPTAVASTLRILAIAVLAFCGCACERTRQPWMAEDVPRVRVRIGKEAAALTLAVKGPWRLVAAEGRISDGDSLDWTRVTASGGNVVVGSIASVDGPVEVHGAEGDPVSVQMPGRRRRAYRGHLRIEPTSGGRLRVANIVPMEAYLAGVLADEMYEAWHLEAFKAQAVAARTYALRRRNTRRRYSFDLYDTPMSQVYGGVGAETKKAWRAVRDTQGVVATYTSGDRRVLLPTYYHSTCGGDTVPAGTVFGGSTPPPLRGGTGCTYCRKSSRYRWRKDVVLTLAEISAAARRSSLPAVRQLGRIARVEVAKRTGGDAGRAEVIRLVDEAGHRVRVRASAWRLMVGARKVPSTWFWIEDRGDAIALVRGRGFGHGVGMCQFGAQFLATHGQTAEQILRYYYPGVELVRAY